MAEIIPGYVKVEGRQELSYSNPSVLLSPQYLWVSLSCTQTTSNGGDFEFSIFNAVILQSWLYYTRGIKFFSIDVKGSHLGIMKSVRGYVAVDAGESAFSIESLQLKLKVDHDLFDFQIEGMFGQPLEWTNPNRNAPAAFIIHFTINDEQMRVVCKEWGERLVDYRNRFSLGSQNV